MHVCFVYAWLFCVAGRPTCLAAYPRVSTDMVRTFLFFVHVPKIKQVTGEIFSAC